MPFHLLVTAIAYVLAPRAAPRCSVRMGLLDWMLEAPYLPPSDQLCRSEGWDLTARLSASVVHESSGPLTYGASLNLGLRFTKDSSGVDTPLGGTVALVAPSPHILDEVGRWEALEMDAGEPVAIRWSLRASDAGMTGWDTSGNGGAIVPPQGELGFTMRLDPNEGTLLRDGRVWLEKDELGTCSASPMPLMGSN